MGRRRKVKVTVTVGPFVSKGRKQEVAHVSQLQDNQAARINATLTDAYGENVNDEIEWTSDGATGEEGAPLVSIVEVAEGEVPGVPAGTYVVAGDDVGGPTVVTGRGVNSGIELSESFMIVASAAVSGSVTTDAPIEKSSLSVEAPPDGEEPGEGEGTEGGEPTP